MKYQILEGDNRQTLKTLADNSVDAIITDPPYGIDFLGKSWDANTGALETYQECLRVLKPGGHILAFSAARTYHHLAITLEQAGFEIRDQIMWIYSSGFPKSQDIGKSIDRAAGKKANNILKAPTFNTNGEKIVSNSAEGQLRCPKCLKTSEARYHCGQGQECGMVYKPLSEEAKQWAGWGTALKPAHEPIALAQKPFKGNIRNNCQKWSVGALNIDATRIPYDGPDDKPVPHGGKARQHKDTPGWMSDNTGYKPVENPEINPIGRFPSNVIGEILQEDYQKYFYCPKVSRAERHIGFDLTNIPTNPNGMYDNGVQFQNQQAFSGNTEKGNNHPTVKPVELMKYLIKLITPPGGIVLDPFNGSGSTGCAAVELGHEYIGCELDPAYVAIAKRRIEAWANKDTADNNFEALFSATE